jgi:hypothetical protein
VSLRVHVFPPLTHDHPVPDIDTRARPAGTFSVTVIVPLAAGALGAFDTVTV